MSEAIKNKKILCIDFDGVIHSYSSGWKGENVVSDPPVSGAIEWLKTASTLYNINIYSSRSKSYDGVLAMKDWLLDNGMTTMDIERIKFPTQKPAAYLTIDDRAICFNGVFPSFDEIDNFKPWNKR
jgi:hypothetical protein